MKHCTSDWEPAEGWAKAGYTGLAKKHEDMWCSALPVSFAAEFFSGVFGAAVQGKQVEKSMPTPQRTS